MFPWRNSAKEAVFRETFVDFDLTEVPEEPSQVCAEDEVAIPHLRGVTTSALMPQPADKRRLKTELLALPKSSDTRRVVTSIKLFEATGDDHRVWNSLARNILDRVLSSGSSDRFIIRDGTVLHLFTVVWEGPGSPDSALLVERRLHDGSVSFVCSEQGVQITPSEYVDCDWPIKQRRVKSELDAGSGGVIAAAREWSVTTPNESADVDDSMIQMDVDSRGNQKGGVKFYREDVDDEDFAEQVHPSLAYNPSKFAVEAFNHFMTDEGDVHDIKCMFGMPVSAIHEHADYQLFQEYTRSGGLVCEGLTHGENILDADGDPLMRLIGVSNPVPGQRGRSEPVQLSRKAKRVIAKMSAQSDISNRARDALSGCAKLVLPPRDEEAKISSLVANSSKVRRCTASYKQRYLLEKCAEDVASRAPRAPWSGNTTTVSQALRFHLSTAEDKAVGYTAFYIPGTRANIQKDPERVDKIVRIAKIRLALRVANAHRLHRMNPWDMVVEGLVDPVLLFIKEEGHGVAKAAENRWRLIWNVSEPDRLLVCWLHSDQDHADVFTFPSDDIGVASSMATGVGHDDESLKRTYRDLEEMLKRSEDGKLRCSDASGWDFSVSASTFWAGWRTKMTRADGPAHRRLCLVSGFFHTNWVLLTGTKMYECQKFGFTGSGMGDTTSCNTAERAAGVKAARVCKQMGGLSKLESSSVSEIKRFVKKDKGLEKATGDDEVSSGAIEEDFLRRFGVNIKVSHETTATLDNPVDYLSHDYFRVDGVWRCEYRNGAKMPHRLCTILSGDATALSERARAAVSGQQFALRHTQDVLEVYRQLFEALKPDGFTEAMPGMEDTGEV